MDGTWIGNYAFSRMRMNHKSPAIVDIDSKSAYTYADLESRANRLANFLLKACSIKKGDRVAVISRNRVELIDLYTATGKTGSILVPYNARLSNHELEVLIASETPSVIFYEDVFADKISGLKKSSIKTFVVLKNAGASAEGLEYEKILSEYDNSFVGCPSLQIEDTHMIIHTGGTTGLPKGGLISHRSELFNSFNEICTWGLQHTDKSLLVLPLFHTGGWHLLTLALFHIGGTTYISRQFNPKETLDIIQKEKITCLFGAAAIFRMMVEETNFKTADLSSLKWVMAGAAPTPKNIMQAFWDKGVNFVLGYGMTEAGPNNISAPPHFMDKERVEAKYKSVGTPMHFTLIKLIDDNGKIISEPDTPGEILWSGPQIFSGYWNNEAETNKTLVDGWVHTGDMAVFDKDGFYYIVGRKKNMFISGGENIFPAEIESAIYTIEGIRECAVFGVADEKWGEVGKAIVSLKPNHKLTKETILQKLVNLLAKYKIPKYITFVDDVPKNSVGKIIMAKIIEQYGQASD